MASGVPPPAAATVSCWNNTVAATVSACPLVNPAPTVALNSANLPVITIAPGATVTGGTLTATAGAISATYTAQPSGVATFASGTLAYATMYTYSLVLNYSNGPSQTLAGTYTTGANPAVIAAIGTKLFNPKMIPFESSTTFSPRIGGPTWMASESAGFIQSFDTGMIFTGLPNVTAKALVGKFFIEPQLSSVCTTLVYKDTGLTVYTDPRFYGGCKTVAFDWVVGTSDGYIMHFPSINKCFKDFFDATAGIGKEEEVVCP